MSFIVLVAIPIGIRFIPIKKDNMIITSTAFGNNEQIPKEYTCDSINQNPPLAFHGIPPQAKSLTLTVEDPDAPSSPPAGGWIHWLVWNINPQTNNIDAHSVPAGAVEGITSFGKVGYGGPCPPTGTHRYIFTLFALDTTLSLGPSAKINDLRDSMNGHVLESTQLIGLYARK